MCGAYKRPKNLQSAKHLATQNISKALFGEFDKPLIYGVEFNGEFYIRRISKRADGCFAWSAWEQVLPVGNKVLP